jgi:hypothetical protein
MAGLACARFAAVEANQRDFGEGWGNGNQTSLPCSLIPPACGCAVRTLRSAAQARRIEQKFSDGTVSSVLSLPLLTNRSTWSKRRHRPGNGRPL